MFHRFVTRSEMIDQRQGGIEKSFAGIRSVLKTMIEGEKERQRVKKRDLPGVDQIFRDGGVFKRLNDVDVRIRDTGWLKLEFILRAVETTCRGVQWGDCSRARLNRTTTWNSCHATRNCRRRCHCHDSTLNTDRRRMKQNEKREETTTEVLVLPLEFFFSPSLTKRPDPLEEDSFFRMDEPSIRSFFHSVIVRGGRRRTMSDHLPSSRRWRDTNDDDDDKLISSSPRLCPNRRNGREAFLDNAHRYLALLFEHCGEKEKDFFS